MSQSTFTLAELEVQAPVIWRGQRNARETIQRFRDCIAILGPNTPAADVRTRELDKLKETLWTMPRIRSPQTINRYLAAISKALRWAAARDMIPGVPYVPREPGESFRLTYFSEAEESAILAYFLDQGQFHLATAIRVLAVTGLRISELLALKSEDIDAGSLHIRQSKNGRDRFVPLEPPLDDALRDALAVGLPPYFVFNRRLHWAMEDRKIAPGKSFHTFRHTCATRLTRLGVPTIVVKDYLGHRSINTTTKYAHVDDRGLREAAKLLEASSALTSALTSRLPSGPRCQAPRPAQYRTRKLRPPHKDKD